MLINGLECDGFLALNYTRRFFFSFFSFDAWILTGDPLQGFSSFEVPWESKLGPLEFSGNRSGPKTIRLIPPAARKTQSLVFWTLGGRSEASQPSGILDRIGRIGRRRY